MKHKVIFAIAVIAVAVAVGLLFFFYKSTPKEALYAEAEDTNMPAATEKIETELQQTEEKDTDAVQPSEEREEEKMTTQENKDAGYYGPLQVNGAHLTDSAGNPVQLRGISTHGLAWYPQYVNEESFAFMHEKWGLNVIRLAMYTAEDDGYCISDENQKKKLEDLIDTGVQLAKANNMYVIIDWHILSDNNPNTYVEEAKTFFKKMSERYRDYDNVLYEICNEPNEGTTWEDICAYAKNVIPVIRENDEDAVIIVGTPEWSQRVDQAAASPITEWKNIMYTLHFYAGTHKEDLRQRAEQALQSGLPIFVSEFGICDASGGGANDFEQADLWMKWMNENSISCVQWNLSNKNETCAFLKSTCTKTTDWEESDLSESGIWMVKNIGGVSLQN